MSDRRADAHIHLFENGFCSPLGGNPVGEDELGAYERLRVNFGIDETLVVGFEGESQYRATEHQRGNNAFIQSLATQHAWIRPLAYRCPGDGRETAADLAEGFVGASVYPGLCADSGRTAAWLHDLIAELDQCTAILSVNVAPEAYALLNEALGDFGAVQVLVSHLGLPAASVAAGRAVRRDLLARPNVSVKVSGLYAVAEPAHGFPHPEANALVAELLDEVGPERLVWGSDFSPCLDFVSFAQTLDVTALTGIDETARTAVFGGNLYRILAGVRR